MINRNKTYVLILLRVSILMAAAQSALSQPSLLTSRVLETVVDSGMVCRDVEYYDGMGRLIQTVSCGLSPQGQDLVTLWEYDAAGERSKEWNPVPISGAGNIADVSLLTMKATEFYDDAHPYRMNLYDGSPLNRHAGRHGGGEQWAASSVTYNVNGPYGVSNCRRYAVIDNSLTLLGLYADGALDVVASQDENGQFSYVFTDLVGNKLLERHMLSHNNYADTYYVYDGHGCLRYILPPMASAALSTENSIWDITTDDNLRRYAFYFAYDSINRQITEKLPGRDAIEKVYDRQNRLMFTQDGVQREKGQYTLYAYYRSKLPAMTAIVHDSRSVERVRQIYKARLADAMRHSTGQQMLYTFSGNGGATSNIINVNPDSVLSYNCYDDYRILSNFAADSDSLQYMEMDGYGHRWCVPGKYPMQPGRLTGQAVRVLRGDGTLGELLPRVFYYDEHGNVIQTRERNALGGYDVTYRRLTRSGQVLSEMRVHSTSSAPTDVTVITNTLDHAGRVTATVMRRGGVVQPLVANTYDEVGRLISCELLNDAETVDYSYNLRSMPTHITGHNSGGFKQQLSYYDSTAGHNVSRVMQDKWDMNGYWVSYDYHYDKMGRLSTATFTCPTILGSYDYSTVYGYDLNSNLTDIKRKGVTSHVGNADYFGYIDNLYLTYNGNQLEKVKDYAPTLTYAGAMDFRDGVDAQVEYEWDSDGRMTRDGNRKIESVEYNAIDLPRRVQYKDGHIVYYTYTADGVKLKASYAFDPLNAVVDPIIGPIDGPIEGPITPINAGAPIVEPQDNPNHPVVDPGIVPETERVQSWRDYCGDYIYLNGELERILTPVGYIDSLEVHHAFVKDYRGNVRADVTEWEGVVERSDYYPYGMQMQVPWSTMWTQPYKFMVKELDRENGWDSYDVHARWLTSPLCQWTTQDPLAEANPWLSPYSYCAGDPVNFVDNNGMKFTESSWEYLNRLISDIDKRQADNNAEIEKQRAKLNIDNLKDKDRAKINKKISKLMSRNAELEAARAEIGVLEGSSQVYDIMYDPSLFNTDYYGMNTSSLSLVTYVSSTNYVEIRLGDRNIYSLAHELKHAYQFETGTYSVGHNSVGAPFYDLTDEQEAYDRGLQFGGPHFWEYEWNYKNKNIQAGPVSILDYVEFLRNNSAFLQKEADRMRCVFRYNGRTYVGENYEK